MEKQTVIKGQKELKRGYTTGTCAAAAARAAAIMLFSGEEIREARITVPAGETLLLEVEEIVRHSDVVSCAVRKDAGDDPDITHGMLVFAEVKKDSDKRQEPDSEPVRIVLEGGEGIGRVTKPGLEQPVGAPAINKVPRKMITEAVRQAAGEAGFCGTLKVTISAPEGEALAQKTFNPRLGIVGGLSILGTTGIVEPMSEQALTETILLEMKVQKQEGIQTLCLVPGNYGSDFLKDELSFSPDRAVKCSNYVGEALDMAVVLGFPRVLLVGHIGKFVKLAAGVMNTHSRMADARAEVFLAALSHYAAGALKEDPGRAEKLIGLVPEIEESVTTDEMLAVLTRAGIQKAVMSRIMERISWHLNQRTRGEVQVELLTFSKEWGILGKTEGAMDLLEQIKEERKGQKE